MNVSPKDIEFMARALRLAQRGIYTADPNPRVGCVIVRGDRVVGEGWHQRAGGHHAEIMALEGIGQDAAGATAYVTLEPCCHHGRTPPCTDALIAAGIGRCVIGSTDPNPAVAGQGESQLSAAGVTVETGVLAQESQRLNRGFFKRMQSQRPYVRSKIAVSIDGRTALANGDSKWITGDAARADVQRFRAGSSAIMTGIGTILSDDPRLNVRDENLGEIRQPQRVVLDSNLQTPADAQIFESSGPIRIFCTTPDRHRQTALEAAGASVEILESRDGRVSLRDTLHRLAELEVNEVLVEAGPGLNGSLMKEGWLDEIVVYIAGNILGSDARGMFDIPMLASMSDRMTLDLVEVRRVGEDCRLTYVS